ncbi:flagellar hook-associated protein FlgL [Spongiibacter nanhainus]|uniref:Flagellar hook-associated protein FlgL n=1 Tax=Spongiibacter nanhainus TaxID=2794344 RepID=A0A7T4R3C5_9GAMM|nr:flagellar hook-associated protein FlgL [Spongiibacter nanhainus]QQD19721.1 flagellar hook-associated protein FlgL [Spongiibacter nanhainus]
MRISTSQMFSLGLGAMLEKQGDLVRTQQQISTGQRMLSPADDPVAAVRNLELSRAKDRTEQYERNNHLLDSRLRLEESVLSESVTLLQRVRELAVQANNATQSNESRQSIALEIRQHLDSLLAYANTQDSDGRYIFSGFQQDTPAFSQTTSGVTYNGDDGQRMLQAGPGRQIADSDPGSAVFMAMLNGNGQFSAAASSANQGDGVIAVNAVADPASFTGQTLTVQFTSSDSYEVVDASSNVVASGSYLSGADIVAGGMSFQIEGQPVAGDSFTLQPAQRQDVFSMLDQLAGSLELGRSNAADRAQQTSEINHALGNLDQALDHILGKQTEVGARMASLDRQVDINAGASLQIEENLSLVNDLDYAEAITRFNQQLTSLQAAQQAFSKVQGLSLFNYL